MFSRLIRVVLTADIARFAGGMGRATSLLGGFLGAARNAFTGAMDFANNLINAIAHLPDAFNTIVEGIEGIFGPALNRERAQAIFSTLTGDAGQAAEMIAFLREQSLGLGKDFDDLLPSAQQVAVALRANNGEIDPAQWEELTMAIIKFSTLRPDVPMELWGRAISGLLSGDVSTLTRLLDINVKDMQTLSAEVQGFLNSSNEAMNQQLGRVTRIGGEAVADKDLALQALREILEATGATDELLQASADSTQGKLDRLKAAWEDFIVRVGEELLPILTEALEKLLEWINTHEEEINTFIESLGETAMEAYDKLKEIDWAEVWEGLQDAGEDIKEAWEWFEDFLATVDALVKKLNEAYELITGMPAPGTPGSMGEIGAPGTLLDQLNGNESPPLSGAAGHAGGGATAGGADTPTPAPQQVEVGIRVSLDRNGNLEAFVERFADEAATRVLGEFVDQIEGEKRGR